MSSRFLQNVSLPQIDPTSVLFTISEVRLLRKVEVWIIRVEGCLTPNVASVWPVSPWEMPLPPALAYRWLTSTSWLIPGQHRLLSPCETMAPTRVQEFTTGRLLHIACGCPLWSRRLSWSRRQFMHVYLNWKKNMHETGHVKRRCEADKEARNDAEKAEICR